MRKPHFAELDRWFKEAFTASLAYMGMADSQVRRAELALGHIEFDTRTNRSVLGSLNQMRFLLDGRVHEVEACDAAQPAVGDPLAVSLPGGSWQGILDGG